MICSEGCHSAGGQRHSVGPEQTSGWCRDDPVNAGSVAAGISKDSFRKGVGRDSERTVGLFKCLPRPEASIETSFRWSWFCHPHLPSICLTSIGDWCYLLTHFLRVGPHRPAHE
ncbi:uncharacterized protein LOC120429563 [Culex pipiens pallens]|uniref:uncharacterized protein LOC120429563 n=1 Tax=Culex pipiens pallens TaxID=42434 RepID=UPI001954D475|nr:uncharacterized protein LOC120429563 [Culex pipiens pallens]